MAAGAERAGARREDQEGGECCFHWCLFSMALFTHSRLTLWADVSVFFTGTRIYTRDFSKLNTTY